MLKGIASISTFIIITGVSLVSFETYKIEKEFQKNKIKDAQDNHTVDNPDYDNDELALIRSLNYRLDKLNIRFEQLEAKFNAFKQTEEERLLDAQKQFSDFNSENNKEIQNLKDYVSTLPQDITSLLNLDDEAIKRLTKVITAEQRKKMLEGLFGEMFLKEFNKLLANIQIEEDKKLALRKDFDEAFAHLVKRTSKILEGEAPIIFIQAFVNKFNKDIKNSFQKNLTTEQYQTFSQNWEKSFLKQFDKESKKLPENEDIK